MNDVALRPARRASSLTQPARGPHPEQALASRTVTAVAKSKMESRRAFFMRFPWRANRGDLARARRIGAREGWARRSTRRRAHARRAATGEAALRGRRLAGWKSRRYRRLRTTARDAR